MKYLVIGGGGFIGGHLCNKLVEEGQEVAVIDKLELKDKEIKSYQVDAEDATELAGIFEREKPDFVYHLAGAINLRRQITDPLFASDLNILERTNCILEAFKQSNAKKFIFVSSGGAIYENAAKVPTSENYNAHPDSLYGLANLIIEKYIEVFCLKNNLDFTILRLSNVYGPRQWKSGIIPSIIGKLLSGESPVIYGDGKQTRDFIYIDDAVEALTLAAKKGGREIYNVGSGEEISLNKILKIISEHINSEIRPVYEKLDKKETSRSALDIQKIIKDFGWQPKTNIKEGLLKTVDWHKQNG